MNTQETTQSFEGLGIQPKLLELITSIGYKTPTPIQFKSIPIAITGSDVMGIAQTGTGKTLAFAIPMIQRLNNTDKIGLVIAPTRELALQIDETFQKLGRSVGLRTTVLIGGASMYKQTSELRNRPRIVICTPGRAMDHLRQRTMRLENVGILVLDEADRMLDMGFEPQIKEILKTVPKERQTMLFSATMPAEIVKIATTYMKAPVRVEIAKAGTTAEKIIQEAFIVKGSDKTRLLEKLLGEYKGTVLVFSRTKHGAKRIARNVRTMGHASAEIHSNCSLAQRRFALEGFKTGKFRVLIATDIAARGIDVSDIEVVINYDLPDHTEDYTHRIGRTARAGKSGRAISFVAPDERSEIRNIERLTRTMLTLKNLPELPPHRAEAHVKNEDVVSHAPSTYGRRSFPDRRGTSSSDYKQPHQRSTTPRPPSRGGYQGSKPAFRSGGAPRPAKPSGEDFYPKSDRQPAARPERSEDRSHSTKRRPPSSAKPFYSENTGTKRQKGKLRGW